MVSATNGRRFILATCDSWRIVGGGIFFRQAQIGVVTSAISLYYYFRVVVFMYLRDSTQATPVPLRAPALVGVIAFCALATLVLGLVPGPFITLAERSVDTSQLLQRLP
jgi:NADH:ubiquinone oxidoreductase subunit 2 (subunit N)